MFKEDKDRELILELKEQVVNALTFELIEPEVEALEDLHNDIDSLILCKAEDYNAVKDAVKSHMLDIVCVLELSPNYYIRKYILPIIDELTVDLFDF